MAPRVLCLGCRRPSTISRVLRTLGDVLPQAVGIAISPIAIVIVIVLLMSERGRATGTVFLAGWIAGIAVVTGAAVALAEGVDAATDPDTRDGIDVIHLLLGLLFVALAVRTWRRRPRAGAEPSEPKLFAMLDTISTPKAAGLGVAIATVAAPKNVALEIAAGSSMAESGLSAASDIVLILLFTMIASVSLLVPMVAALGAPDRTAGTLTAARQWLVANSTPIMLVLFVVLAAHHIGKGLGIAS